LISLIAGIVAISFGLIELKLYRNRNKNNNWGIFYQASIDLRRLFDKEGYTVGKIELYFAIFGIILGVIILVSIFV
jgi:hypothetical protein